MGGLTKNLGATSCSLCEAGKQLYYSIASGNTCVDCLRGKISTKGGNCTSCQAGTYSSGDLTNCIPCGKGKWSSQVGATGMSTCKIALPGFIPMPLVFPGTLSVYHAFLDDI